MARSVKASTIAADERRAVGTDEVRAVIADEARGIVADNVQKIITEEKISLAIANVENSAGGFGVTPSIAEEMLSLGLDVLTTGNHVWDKRELYDYIPRQERLLRPANYSETLPGSGLWVGKARNGVRCAVINMQGRSYMPSTDDPFRKMDTLLAGLPEDVKVVILGQDPYHTPGVADGLAFSSFSSYRVPPSLQNIYKEIEMEFGVKPKENPDLTHWANQGVLLLNSSLTVESEKANSHVDFGWHKFTDEVISIISRECEHVVFMLWGNYARSKKHLIDESKHLLLESAHPSPLSAHRGFFGNNHFKKANEYLEKNSRVKILWY